MLKTMIMGLGLAALLAAPALAQSYDPDLGSGNVMTPPSAVYNAPAGLGTPDATTGNAGPYAYAPQRLHTPRVRHNTQRQQQDDQER